MPPPSAASGDPGAAAADVDATDVDATDVDAADAGARLMERVRDGDREAFAELVERYQRPVLSAVFRYTGNRASAEELAQEVFVRIYRAREGYERKARFETWLYRIVFNLCANAADRDRRRRALSIDGGGPSAESEPDAAPGIPVADPAAESPLQALEGKEARERVHEAILLLPEQQRAALLLSRFENLPHQEVARCLGTSIEAVKSLLFRARENLRHRLRPYLQEEVRDAS